MTDGAEPENDLIKAHGVLTLAYNAMLALYGHINGASTDTAFAIGEATGVLNKAKALVGRDIDQLRASKEPVQ